MKNLSDHLPLNVPVFALIPEVEPSFLSAALLAAASAGFDLNGLALRTRFDPVQVLWHRQAFTREHPDYFPIDPASVRQALLANLREHGEPVTYLNLHAAGLESLAAGQSLQWHEDALNQTLEPILAALQDPQFVHHGGTANPETGLWGLAEWDSAVESLPDRVEVLVVRLLQEKGACTIRDIEAALNNAFPGLQTPSLGLLQAVLVSYAVEIKRSLESPSRRRSQPPPGGYGSSGPSTG